MFLTIGGCVRVRVRYSSCAWSEVEADEIHILLTLKIP